MFHIYLCFFRDTDLEDSHGLKERFSFFSEANIFHKSVIIRVLFYFMLSYQPFISFGDTDFHGPARLARMAGAINTD